MVCRRVRPALRRKHPTARKVFYMINQQPDITFTFEPPRQFIDVNIRLLKVRSHGKEAIERGWQTTRNYSARSPEIKKWIDDEGNYGLTSPQGFACFVDADASQIQDALETKLPKTFRWSTGKEGHFQYAYFIEDGPIGCLPLTNGAYIKAKGGYVIGPGSVHWNGTVYGSREIRNMPIAIVKKQELLDALKDFIIGKEQSQHKPKQDIPNGQGKILTVLQKYNVDYSKYKIVGPWLKGPHPIHGSETGTNFAVNTENNVWHCFRHNTGGGVVSLIAVLEGFVDCKDVQDGD